MRKLFSGDPRELTWVGTLARLALLVLFVFLANYGASKLIGALDIQIWPEYMEIVDRAVIISVILYIVLMATPFLPGIEIGLMLMLLLGPRGVVIAYLCTLVALSLSFGVGRIFPPRLLVSLLRWLNLQRAAALLENFSATPPAGRLAFLADGSSGRAVPALLERRYLLLAVLLNVPGNAVIGGGGGIAMMAGMSRLYAFPAYVLLVSVAILPGPILILLTKYLQ